MIWDCKIFLVTYSVLFGYCIIQEYHTLSPIVWYYSGERSRDGIQQRPPHVSEQLRLRRDTLRTRLDCGESHLHCNRRIENNGCSNTLCKYVIHVYVLKSIVSEVYRLILFYHLFKKQNHQRISLNTMISLDYMHTVEIRPMALALCIISLPYSIIVLLYYTI